MASSSVSQEDMENDFELSSRRSRIRTARARTVNPPTRIDTGGGGGGEGECGGMEVKPAESLSIGSFPSEHDASPKPLSRSTKDKRAVRDRCVPVRQPLTEHVNRTNHLNKGKQRDRRKLREKRRSTGVVHMPSTESTGNSTGEEENEGTAAETRRNTHHNEISEQQAAAEPKVSHKAYTQRRNKSPSDLEADDEDNQEFDSLNQSDSTVSSLVHAQELPPRPRPGTPTGDKPEELLERAQEENRRLLSLLEDRDHKISTLESRILQLQRELVQERDRLRDENTSLIRAMATLATSK